MNNHHSIMGLTLGASLALAGMACAQTTEPRQLLGLNGWTSNASLTIGETVDGYTPPGLPDGMGAFARGGEVYIVVNHELRPTAGYPYQLANGATLTGGRVSTLVFDAASRQLTGAGLSYDKIYNRAGVAVAGPADLESGGLNRLCSAGSFTAGQAGFVNDVFLTGEEAYGGTEFALDVVNGELWALPWLGRAAWEAVAALEVPTLNKTHVAIVVGDDRGDAPLLLYVGEKIAGGNFIERNGLAKGDLYMWVADNGDLSPADWNGTGSSRKGSFVKVKNYDPARAGSATLQSERGFDSLGFATQAELDSQKVEIGAFNFSRPEDVHVNPKSGKGNQVVLASTGRTSPINQGKDQWGTTYLIDIKINRGRIQTNHITADLKVLFDGDDAAGNGLSHPDFGIRTPDNLVWADDGVIYIQEDRSVSGFGLTSGEEASIWTLDPKTSAIERIGQMNRIAVPAGQVDVAPTDIGNWESSGIIDVTDEFQAKGERLLFFNVQGHSLRGGAITSQTLVEGGQFLFLSRPE